MDKALGDGGMPLLGQLGVDFRRYGEGWVEAAWTPTESDLGAKTITVKVSNGTDEAQASVVVTVRSATIIPSATASATE